MRPTYDRPVPLTRAGQAGRSTAYIRFAAAMRRPPCTMCVTFIRPDIMYAMGACCRLVCAWRRFCRMKMMMMIITVISIRIISISISMSISISIMTVEY